MASLDLKRYKTVRAVQLERLIDGGAYFRTECDPLEVTAAAPGVYRLRMGRRDEWVYPILDFGGDAPAYEFKDENDTFSIMCGDSALHLTPDPFRVRLTVAGKTRLQSVTDAHFARPYRLPAFARGPEGWCVSLSLGSSEPVFGIGEKYGPLNRRGQLVYSRNEDALGVNAEISYKNCPFAWSPSGWGVFLHTPASAAHGVGYPQWSHRSYVLKLEDDALDLFIIAGAAPSEILDRYTGLTGKSPLLPLWSYGVWISRAYYKNAQEAMEVSRTLREKKIPSDVFTLDGRAWLDTKTRFAFEWDASRYADPSEFTAQLKALHLKLCVWEYPLVSIHHPLFRELAEKGWLLKNGEGKPYIHHWDMSPFGEVLTPLPPSGLVDFTHPEAYAWYKSAHSRLFDSGIDVIKSDFGEQVPDDAFAHNGDSGRRLHNVYALLYNRCVYEAARDRFGKDALVWARSGWSGSQRYPVQWGGDPQADWEGLAAGIRGGLSWGLSGAPFYSHDIGGFYGGPPDAELFIRWSQAGVLASHCRFHGIGPREPWYFGEEAETIVRQWLDFRYRLLPYLQECGRMASETGLPVMRAMVLAFPDDPPAWSFDGQYMLGDRLLVAPVIQPGGEKQVYLPEGEWFDYWTAQKIEGPILLNTRSPLDRMPLFGRAGTILPLGPAVQCTHELDGQEPVEKLLVFGFPTDVAPSLSRLFEGEFQGERKILLKGLPPTTKVEVYGDVATEYVDNGIIINRI